LRLARANFCLSARSWTSGAISRAGTRWAACCWHRWTRTSATRRPRSLAASPRTPPLPHSTTCWCRSRTSSCTRSGRTRRAVRTARRYARCQTLSQSSGRTARRSGRRTCGSGCASVWWGSRRTRCGGRSAGWRWAGRVGSGWRCRLWASGSTTSLGALLRSSTRR
ncbi:hypothetical protein HK405_011838, partial [Cladochytrium tenue]